jgi:hypothetical protein
MSAGSVLRLRDCEKALKEIRADVDRWGMACAIRASGPSLRAEGVRAVVESVRAILATVPE